MYGLTQVSIAIIAIAMLPAALAVLSAFVEGAFVIVKYVFMACVVGAIGYTSFLGLLAFPVATLVIMALILLYVICVKYWIKYRFTLPMLDDVVTHMTFIISLLALSLYMEAMAIYTNVPIDGKFILGAHCFVAMVATAIWLSLRLCSKFTEAARVAR